MVAKRFVSGPVERFAPKARQLPPDYNLGTLSEFAAQWARKSLQHLPEQIPHASEFEQLIVKIA